MPRLIVNPDSPEAWEIELHPGVNSLGRSEENDFLIEHSSISSFHCQILVSEHAARVKDVGSTAGTFIEGQLVEEAPLLSGQIFCLGEVAMRFESGLPEEDFEAASPPLASSSPPVTTAPAVVQAAAVSAYCKSHPRASARYFCPSCQVGLCELCVNSRLQDGRNRRLCRTCNTECNPLAVRRPEAAQIQESFAARLGGAFVYPFLGDGVVLLIAGAILYFVMGVAGLISRYAWGIGGIAILIMGVLGNGYLLNYLRQIITSSALGAKTMPDWPEVTEISSDILSPLFQFLGTVIASFLPLLLVAYFVPHDSASFVWLLIASGCVGCVYFPMAFLAVAMFDSVAAVNPMLIVPSILRISWAYLLTVTLLAVILAVRLAAASLLPSALLGRLLCELFFNFLGIYLLAVEMRILGLLYLSKKEELGWFSK